MKTFKYFMITSVMALAFCGCRDFFEMERPPQFPINTVADLEFAAVSPYNKIFYGGWGAFQSNHLLNEVMLSDHFKWIGNVEDYPTEDIYMRRFGQRISQIEELYGKLYTAIGVCNSGLSFYTESNDDPIPYASKEDKDLNVKRIKGELLFMRAYSYYYLSIIFCPPYGYGKDDMKILVKRDHMSVSSDDALNNAPVPTSEIYDMIVEDLKDAILLLPEDWTEGMHESYKSRGRANVWAAKALLAQVYFTMQRFDEALALYDDIIDNSGYTLEENPFTNFCNESTLPLRSENKEVIMWMFYADGDMQKTRHNSLRMCMMNKCKADAQMGGNGPDATGRIPNWSFCDWLQMCMAPSALQKMGWMDASGAETEEARYDKRYYNQPANAGNYVNKEGLFYRFEGCDPSQSSKRTGASADGLYIAYGKYAAYVGENDPVVVLNKTFRSNTGRLQNIPLFRMGEIYLNRAAVRQKLGVANWSQDYNKVAERAWNVDLSGQSYQQKSDDEIDQEDIRIERWKELAGEDSWYINYCAALGLEIDAADRYNQSGEFARLNAANYGEVYWKNCIPLSSELDFR